MPDIFIAFSFSSWPMAAYADDDCLRLMARAAAPHNTAPLAFVADRDYAVVNARLTPRRAPGHYFHYISTVRRCRQYHHWLREALGVVNASQLPRLLPGCRLHLSSTSNTRTSPPRPQRAKMILSGKMVDKAFALIFKQQQHILSRALDIGKIV